MEWQEFLEEYWEYVLFAVVGFTGGVPPFPYSTFTPVMLGIALAFVLRRSKKKKYRDILK